MSETEADEAVTMVDVLEEQAAAERAARAVLGGSDDGACTWPLGPQPRQALYACVTCGQRAGFCLACSLSCHDGHELLELYTKRAFRCDCGGPDLPPCRFAPPHRPANSNRYNHNFDGRYCTCRRPYPDPDPDAPADAMLQCAVCEDWLHARHLGAPLPPPDRYEELTCADCVSRLPFLRYYLGVSVGLGPDDTLDVTETDFEDESADRTAVFDATTDDLRCNGTKPLAEVQNGHPKVDVVEKTDSKDDVVEKTDSKDDVVEKMDSKDDIVEKTDSKDDVIEKMDSKDDIVEKTDSKDDVIEKTDLKVDVVEKIDSKDDLVEKSDSKDDVVEKIDSKDDVVEKTDSKKDDVVEKTDSEDASNLNIESIPENVKSTAETVAEKPSSPPDSTIDKESNVDLELSEVFDERIAETADQKLNVESPTNVQTNDDAIPDPSERVDPAPAAAEVSKDVDESNPTEIQTAADVLESPSTVLDEPSADDKEPDVELSLSSETPAIIADDESKSIETTPIVQPQEAVDSMDVDPILKLDGLENEKSNSSPDVKINEASTEEPCSKNEDKKDDATTENGGTPIKTDDLENPKMEVDGSETLKCEKRKLDEEPDRDSSKKIKLSEEDDAVKCTRPALIPGLERKGAVFWPSDWRMKLCVCPACHEIYREHEVLFLLDTEDTVTAYENLGKSKTSSSISQYDRGLEALSSLDRVQQINAITEYNKMKEKLLEFLKTFKDKREVVKEEDIKDFFAGMKPKREPDGVYFCR